MSRIANASLAQSRRLLNKRRRLARAAMRHFSRNIEMLRQNARNNGYALAVHGTLLRDIDLLAAPWTPQAKPARALKQSLFTLLLALYGGKGVYSHSRGHRKPHGRRAWSIHLPDGVYIDLSVMPRKP